MLRTNFDAVERSIIAQSGIVSSAGHTLHRGYPREHFIKSFLETHVGARAAIGTGEIISADSRPRESRNQIDIAIYRADYPKLDLGGDTNVFLAESVIATIEVKSTLDSDKLGQAIRVANKVKQLKREMCGFSVGYLPPSIVSYVVAYDGPANMNTVHGWLSDIHRDEGISIPRLPESRQQRNAVACPSIDAVFILGRGFLYFDNTLTGYVSNPIHAQHPDAKWIYSNSEDGNLYLLFIFLTDVIGCFFAGVPRLTSYLRGSDLQIQWGE
ncbi:MAG: DUF6602 domain-containing protein [Phycisphaerales bacterium]